MIHVCQIPNAERIPVHRALIVIHSSVFANRLDGETEQKTITISTSNVGAVKTMIALMYKMYKMPDGLIAASTLCNTIFRL